MKSLSPALQAHLDGGATTMAYCWRVTRRDGAVLGFTEHDRDVVTLGSTFAASTGFTASQISQGLGLSVDNLQASGALSSDGITEADILAGRYDGAAVEVFWVNWQEPTQAVTLAKGDLGELKREGLAFSAELRSLANRLGGKIGWTYERTCSAVLGDARCKVDVSSASYRASVTVTAAGTARELAVSGLEGFATDWFTAGTLTLSTGEAAGLAFEVKTHRRSAGVDYMDLWLPPPVTIAAGDHGVAVAGCRKTLATCRAKFNNVVNFRGYPHIPGSDSVTRYGVQGAAAEGGSIFGGSS